MRGGHDKNSKPIAHCLRLFQLEHSNTRTLEHIFKHMKNIIITSLTFLLALSYSYAESPDWSVSTTDYEFSMSYSAVVILDEQEIRDTSDRLSAWVGDEIRGVTKPFYLTSLDRYYFLLLVYANDTDEEITFQFYDSSEDSIFTLTNTDSFLLEESYGNFSSPYKFVNTAITSNEEDDNSTEEDIEVTIFPNPCEGIVTIDSEESIESISLLSCDGSLLETTENNTINLAIYSGGKYFIRIETENSITTRMVVKAP